MEKDTLQMPDFRSCWIFSVFNLKNYLVITGLALLSTLPPREETGARWDAWARHPSRLGHTSSTFPLYGGMKWEGVREIDKRVSINVGAATFNRFQDGVQRSFCTAGGTAAHPLLTSADFNEKEAGKER